MWAMAAASGSVPWCFHTTIGTPHASQSATQQISSSKYQWVKRSAEQSSHSAPPDTDVLADAGVKASAKLGDKLDGSVDGAGFEDLADNGRTDDDTIGDFADLSSLLGV